VRSWELAWTALSDSPRFFLLGLGPGNYAGVAAARTALNRGALYEALSVHARATLLATAGATGAAAWVTNSWANLVTEFGALGTLWFVFAVTLIVIPIFTWKPPDDFGHLARLTFFVGLLSVLWQGSVTPYTNWAEPVLMYPLMMLAAYCWWQAVVVAPAPAAPAPLLPLTEDRA
jgi:hypothetical protein